MKEIRLKRVPGPFKTIPFDNFIQSPIGLVPKAGGDQTRLIFPLSYDFEGKGEDRCRSLNKAIPREFCFVTYNDLDHAVRQILIIRDEEVQRRKLLGNGQQDTDAEPVVVYFGKSDVRSAFRVLLLSRKSFLWLVMMAQKPVSNEWVFFVDKCLPFGASISCALFQRVSNGIRHIGEFETGSPLTNYLDDFLFFALLKQRLNFLLSEFIHIRGLVGMPIALEKTEWATTLIMFLGILLDGERFILSLPLEKQEKAVYLLERMVSKRKVTVHELQSLCGFFEFFEQSDSPR